MRIAVLILGFVFGAVMVTQAVVTATLSALVRNPFGSAAGDADLLMALLWLFGVAFVLGGPVVSVIAFGAATALGLSLGIGSASARPSQMPNSPCGASSHSCWRCSASVAYGRSSATTSAMRQPARTSQQLPRH
jgi:hypothetical protein